MPYKKRKQKCTQSDGDKGNYVLSYTTKKGEKRRACHTSKKNMQGQIAAIEAEADMSEEEVIEEELRSLVREAIVNFNGKDYDIPDDEAEKIAKQIEFGDAAPEPENSRVFSMERISSRLDSDLGDKADAVRKVANVYPDDTAAQILKQVATNSKDLKDALFSVTPTLGGEGTFPGEVWKDLINVHRPGRSKAVGRGEIALSLLFKGVTPDSGSGSHDLEISGLGDVHVKEVSTSNGFANPDVPMGKSLSSDDRNANWYRSLEQVSGFTGRTVTKAIVQSEPEVLLDAFADLTGQPSPGDLNSYEKLADEWQKDFSESFIDSLSWGNAGALIFVDKGSGQYFIAGPDDEAPYRIDDSKWRVGRADRNSSKWSEYIKTALRKKLAESALRSMISGLLVEDLTGSDKSEIKRMIKKELEGSTNRKEIDKAFKKNFDKELRKALGASFFGTPGKINKFVIDEIQKEVEKNMGSSANREVVVRICKDVLVKLYRELSFSYKPVIDRMKV